MHHNRKRTRKCHGSLLLYSLLIAIFAAFVFAMVAINYAIASTTFDCLRLATEGASLVASESLARIIVDDPHYGYIALTDYAPIGRGTVAGDGESLPVKGINTILATNRLDWIIANQIQDPDLIAIAKEENVYGRLAADNLIKQLKKALNANGTNKFYDIDAHQVNPNRDARVFFDQYLRNRGIQPGTVKSFVLSLGYLQSGCGTNISIPQPINMSQTNRTNQVNGCYKAYIDIPAFDEHFQFAGLGQENNLVDLSKFQVDDGKHTSSAVRAEATAQISLVDMFSLLPSQAFHFEIHAGACSQPANNRNLIPGGILAITFPNGPVSRVGTLYSLLEDPVFKQTRADARRAKCADFPNQSGSYLAPCEIAPWADKPTLSQSFALGIYCWLQSNFNRPRIDSVIDSLKTYSLNSMGSSCDLWDIDKEGKVVMVRVPYTPFPIGVVSEEQEIFAASPISSALSDCTISCTIDNINQGIASGGRHAGQPLAGDPINWCDLPYFACTPEMALSSGRGALALGLELKGDDSCDKAVPGAISYESATFYNRKTGRPLTTKPRKSYYSGGLATEFEIVAIAH